MFEIFSLGDTQTFAEVLNGVAMMFSNSPILKGNGPLQLGFGAFLGAMVLFTVMLYRAVFENRFEWKTLLVPLIFYIILTVPKTSVVINDIYNVEAPKRVDNVPIGLAIPASVISGISSVLTQYIEKAFYILPADNITRPSTQLTQNGFLTPLQVMNAIRYDNLNTDHPLLQQAFNKIYATCIVGNDSWSPDEYGRSKDAAGYFQSVLNSTQRVVSFTVSQAGEGSVQTMTCADAGSYVKEAMNVHLTGKSTDPTGLLGSNFKKTSFTEKMSRAMAVNNSYGKLKGPTGTIKYTDTEVAGLLSSITGMTVSDSRAFMMNVLFDPMVRTATKCTSDFSLDQISKCTTWISTLEQWKDRSAASGTSFLKKMKDGQNMMVLVGFMLFPFMVFMIMLQGMSSKKMVGGYIAFMVSNYLWLPMAAIINFYGQYTFQDAIYMIKIANPDGFFTINQAPHLYDVVTTKLSVANNAMGMVPVFCSMLFGGMMWAVNSFSKAINPADNGYDAKVNSKPIMNSAPLNSHSSIMNKDGFGATTILGVGSSDVNVSSMVSAARTKSSEIDDQIALKLSRLDQLSARSSESIGNSLSNSGGHRHSDETGREQLASYSDSESKSNQKLLDGKIHSEQNVHDSDSLAVKSEKSSNTRLEGGLELGAKAQTKLGSKQEGKSKDKTQAAVGISTSVDNTVLNVGGVNVNRGVVNDLTEIPTFNSTVKDTNGLRGGTFNNKDQVTTENILSKIKNSKDANFKATALNEIIQSNQSNAYTAAEKREAAQLTSEVRGLSAQKSESIQWVMANGISDSDLVGRTNVLAPNSKLVNQALDKTDALGRETVTNWDQLKADAEKILRQGGNSVPEAIERASIFVAARHSGNADVMLSGLDAISPHSTVVDTFRERGTISNLLGADELIKDEKAHLSSLPREINNVEALKQAQLKYGTNIDEASSLVNQVENSVTKSIDLTGQNFDEVTNVDVFQRAINKDEKLAKINQEYNSLSTELSSQAPAIIDSNGKLITPKMESYRDYSTEYDRQLAVAQKGGDNEEIIRLINERQQLELGNNAAVDKAASTFNEKTGVDKK
jgi:conjugal transfer mating pair stabilization protein TraG